MAKRKSASATATTTTTVRRERKRSRVSKPESEPEFFNEQREYEDLWKQAFNVGTELDLLNALYELEWNFSNLEDAFEEGGVLHDKNVYLFSCTESPSQVEASLIPIVVAAVSPFPPSDKMAVSAIQGAYEDIVDMKKMKMDWVPYIPLGKRGSSVERLKSKILILNCVQRRAGLKHLKEDRVKKFEYCLPYFYDPLKEDDTEQSTIVHMVYPIEPNPVVCEFDWEFYDELEDFTDNLIAAENLSEDQKDAFMEFVKEKVREGKRANREAREERKRALEKLSEEEVAAFKSTRFYKFYPVAPPDTPDFLKSSFINRYYGKAHQVF